jgi:hypothetical protein
MLSWRGYLLPNPVILLSAFAAGYLNSFQYALPIGRGEGDTLPPPLSQHYYKMLGTRLWCFFNPFTLLLLLLFWFF